MHTKSQAKPQNTIQYSTHNKVKVIKLYKFISYFIVPTKFLKHLLLLFQVNLDGEAYSALISHLAPEHYES